MDTKLEIMNVLVTGSTGLVGLQLVNDLIKENHKVYSGYHKTKPESGIPILLDLSELDSIPKIIQETKPDVIIHLAAMTDVDSCEAQEALALTINCKATETLAKEAAMQGAFFIYVSTDYVFDGTKELYDENDLPSPLSVYGRTKLEGEKKVQNLASSWCIARTSTPFGTHLTRNSFPLWVAKNLKLKKEINVLTDQYTSPTYVPNLSKMLIEIATRQIVGILHVAGASRISRNDFAQLVAKKLDLDADLIKPTSIDDMSWRAKRPKDSSLDVSQATFILNEKPLKIEQSLELFIKDISDTL